MAKSETKMTSSEPQSNETTIVANYTPDSTEVLHNAQLGLVILG